MMVSLPSLVFLLSISCLFSPSTTLPVRFSSHASPSPSPSLVMPRPQPVRTLSAFVVPKGYRVSVSHLLFYISTFIIATQLWSIWRQTGGNGFVQHVPTGDWAFDADVHANVHTLSHEQCDTAFPKLYHSLDRSVTRRAGRKVHIQDIEIAEGRCMLRVMIYQGEVCTWTRSYFGSRGLMEAAIRCQFWTTRKMLRNEWQRARAHPRNARPDGPRPRSHAQLRPHRTEYRVFVLAR